MPSTVLYRTIETIIKNPNGTCLFMTAAQGAEVINALIIGEGYYRPLTGYFYFSTEDDSEALLVSMFGDGESRTFKVTGYEDYFTTVWEPELARLRIDFTLSNTRKLNPWDFTQTAGPPPGPAPIPPPPPDPTGENIKNAANIGVGEGRFFSHKLSTMLYFRSLLAGEGSQVNTYGSEVTVFANVMERETFTLSSTDISHKYIMLTYEPTPVSTSTSFVIGSPPLVYGDDFVILDDGMGEGKLRKFSWQGLDLEPLLEAGDVLEVIYPRAGHQ